MSYQLTTAKVWDGGAWIDAAGGGDFVSAKTSSTKTGTYTDANGFVWDYFDYTANGSFVVTEAGWADILVVGGGASGRQVGGGYAAGGGGGVRYGMFYVPTGTITVTVGSGGSGAGTNLGNIGGTSSFGSILKVGGGAAGGRWFANNFVYSQHGGGGGAGGVNNNTTSDANGAGAGGSVSASNQYDGITLNYNGSSLEFGKGGTTATPTANLGQGGDGDVDGGAGSAGRVIVKVKA